MYKELSFQKRYLIQREFVSIGNQRINEERQTKIDF